MQFLVFLYFYFVANVVALDFPSYVKKCSAKDPELNKCLRNRANEVIPHLVKGDRILGIPVLSPVKIPKLDFQDGGFKLSLTDVHFDNFKDFTLSDVIFDLQGSNIQYTLNSKYLNFTSNYALNNAQIMRRNVFGRGRFRMVLVNNAMRYKTGVELSRKHGGTYIRGINADLKLESEKVYFYFENVRDNSAQDAADTNIFLQEHSRAIFEEIRPGIERLVLSYIETVVTAINEKIPVETTIP